MIISSSWLLVVKLMENNDWEIAVLKNKDLDPIINSQWLFSVRNNIPENAGR